MTTKGSMTNEERLRKTIHFEKTDKILSGPNIMQFAATYAGITQQEFMDDSVKAEAAYEKTFVELGGWDIGRPFIQTRSSAPTNPIGFAIPTLRPGQDVSAGSVIQFVEHEVMLPEDYDYAIDNGFNALLKRVVERSYPNSPEIKPSSDENKENQEREAIRKVVDAKWDARSVVNLMNYNGSIPPFDFFYFHRSIAKFPLDMRRMPDKIKAASKACMPDIIANAKKVLDGSKIKRMSTACSRGSNTFISNKQFEEFVLPDWLEWVWAMADYGADIIFHCDCSWTKFLPYFKEFPAKRCILQIDGVTDIFKAKEVLKDHMVLHGDVPAPLLTLGTPEQVTDYCKKLIQEVGKDGGFILGAGCSVPFNAKIENVRAMVKAGNELTWY
jgi:hypothetical protein